MLDVKNGRKVIIAMPNSYLDGKTGILDCVVDDIAHVFIGENLHYIRIEFVRNKFPPSTQAVSDYQHGGDLTDNPFKEDSCSHAVYQLAMKKLIENEEEISQQAALIGK